MISSGDAPVWKQTGQATADKKCRRKRRKLGGKVRFMLIKTCKNGILNVRTERDAKSEI